MNWISDLMDEYPTNRSDTAVTRLRECYKDESPEVMLKAIQLYMTTPGNEFFPKVSSLAKYVQEAKQFGSAQSWGGALIEAKLTDDYTAVDMALYEYEMSKAVPFGD